MKGAAGSYEGGEKIASQVRLIAAGNAYAANLTPLAFPGWTLATVIP
jgi:adenylate cyclase